MQQIPSVLSARSSRERLKSRLLFRSSRHTDQSLLTVPTSSEVDTTAIVVGHLGQGAVVAGTGVRNDGSPVMLDLQTAENVAGSSSTTPPLTPLSDKFDHEKDYWAQTPPQVFLRPTNDHSIDIPSSSNSGNSNSTKRSPSLGKQESTASTFPERNTSFDRGSGHRESDKDEESTDSKSQVSCTSTDSGLLSSSFKQQHKSKTLSDTDRPIPDDSRLSLYRTAFEQYKLASDGLAEVHLLLEPAVSKASTEAARLRGRVSRNTTKIKTQAIMIEAELVELQSALASVDVDISRLSKDLNTLQDRHDAGGLLMSRNAELVSEVEEQLRVIQRSRDSSTWGDLFWLMVSWMLSVVALMVWTLIRVVRLARRIIIGSNGGQADQSSVSLIFSANAEQVRERLDHYVKSSISRHTLPPSVKSSERISLINTNSSRKSDETIHKSGEPVLHMAGAKMPVTLAVTTVTAASASSMATHKRYTVPSRGQFGPPMLNSSSVTDTTSSVGQWSADDDLFGGGSQASDPQSTATGSQESSIIDETVDSTSRRCWVCF